MLLNLRAEMVRRQVSIEDIAKLLGVAVTTARNKLAGRTPFTVNEALKIQKSVFPDKEIDYLFGGSMGEGTLND